MRFLIDAQLPPALCGWFGERGFEVGLLGTLMVVGDSQKCDQRIKSLLKIQLVRGCAVSRQPLSDGHFIKPFLYRVAVSSFECQRPLVSRPVSNKSNSGRMRRHYRRFAHVVRVVVFNLTSGSNPSQPADGLNLLDDPSFRIPQRLIRCSKIAVDHNSGIAT